ncbi:MAG TPA: PhzF family phenazine biosynthesis protein [Acidimicrobiales bacterium]|nr:PhzF family phenazine biosynthesis protein [Acidimicrobiales bacterium]
MRLPFTQVDVFTAEPFLGNPVAVVLDADGLDTDRMQAIARWTNLSETTFVAAPTDPAADYAVRIFTPAAELPFAGHPTLGTCHAWLAAGGRPAAPDVVIQQCGVGPIRIRRGDGRLAFAAPPLVRSGPVDDDLLDELVATLGVTVSDVVDAAWVDNGPGWVAVLLADVDTVLALRPRPSARDIGVVALCPPGSAAAIEVRGFFPVDGTLVEDPVTGSLNASLAQWLLGSGRLRAPYVARQGTVLGRRGVVHVDRDDAGDIWVGGDTVTCVDGEIAL